MILFIYRSGAVKSALIETFMKNTLSRGDGNIRNFYILTIALAYVEEHLRTPFSREEVAAYCHVSLSSLEKLFRYALHYSLGEYIAKRRMSEAAQDIINGCSVTETAFTYQYSSPEAFSRAFRRIFGIPPLQFRKEQKICDIFPRLTYEPPIANQGKDARAKGGNTVMIVPEKQTDVRKMYACIAKHANTYSLAFDLQDLMKINQISFQAGDTALQKAVARITEVANTDMPLFRIGNDEFVLLTGYPPTKQEIARSLLEKVLSKNEETFFYQGKEIPLSLHGTMEILPTSNGAGEDFISSIQKAHLSCKVKS